jgi:hypothetical protein
LYAITLLSTELVEYDLKRMPRGHTEGCEIYAEKQARRAVSLDFCGLIL